MLNVNDVFPNKLNFNLILIRQCKDLANAVTITMVTYFFIFQPQDRDSGRRRNQSTSSSSTSGRLSSSSSVKSNNNTEVIKTPINWHNKFFFENLEREFKDIDFAEFLTRKSMNMSQWKLQSSAISNFPSGSSNWNYH